METPYYQYDISHLRQTLAIAKREADIYGYHINYALKANSNSKILKVIAEFGLGADCVSGNEIKTALKNGFLPSKIVYAGVGKTDEEISYAIDNNIFCFHCESIQELEVINKIAEEKNYIATVALRINPNIDAKTHKNITTGTHGNKFGITPNEAKAAIQLISTMKNIQLIGLHFHIGSQITNMDVFSQLAVKASELQQMLLSNFQVNYINLGGGLGIDYENPETNSIPDFKSYFASFAKNLALNKNQQVHFELGRSLVGQCGKLITKVLYTKTMDNNNFIVVDAGMNTLIRPALYGAHHKIVNIISTKTSKVNYNIVGPICESTDSFGDNIVMPETQRGDVLEILSCGAYGEVMSSRYNLRDLPGVNFTNMTINSTTLTQQPSQCG